MRFEDLIISVYKTSLSENDLIDLKPILDNFDKVSRWTTDLEDCDNILRIESQFSIEKEVISTLQTLNIECTELQ
jgi:hypothetical protein